jgi:galactokinase
MMRDRAAAFAPGRVNLIGEHTDYNDGLSLPFAIADGVTVTAEAIACGRIVALARDLGAGAGEEDRFDAAAPERPRGGGWRAFVRGIAAELQAAELPVRPARLELHGTVPRGAGLSSSAALSVAVALGLLALSGAEGADRRQLARICSRVENDWVGARTGLLDQLASLFGERDRVLRIDFRSLAVEPAPLRLGDWQLVTVDSHESHDVARSGYNTRREECAEAARLLGIDSLRDAPADAFGRLPEPLGRRVRHVQRENGRVAATVRALQDDDLAAVGRLLDASHASLRDDYAASTDAVEATVARLKAAGAAGARMVGGGFGGHVLALLPPGAAIPEDGLAVRPDAGARLV